MGEHDTKPAVDREFTERAASAWIRAADAGVIDAGELAWLLAHLDAGPVAEIVGIRG
ncbi:hypothetical protein [Amycolatopsis saalfeldensis]|uniref:Uncharacterized protein n=1 Tax=Amycolatopsis saalfeldensis TaxID=394193 RepID=A0A1H8PSW8_9PSEU|nr:hypothetical protein [Amycolatopsis saalfeldensis]SEO44774.1 hypothetical protein SAMN04489732_10151 [Amycolatopsis saalfeldensis]